MTPAAAAAHAAGHDWDELREAVRNAARTRGLRVIDIGTAIGRRGNSVATVLYSENPPATALQDALRAWLKGKPVPATPVGAPPSRDPRPRSRMRSPSAKNSAPGDLVSSEITATEWEYRVHRLPDHDWGMQREQLNVIGADGWRLVCVSGGVAYLERLVRVDR